MYLFIARFQPFLHIVHMFILYVIVWQILKYITFYESLLTFTFTFSFQKPTIMELILQIFESTSLEVNHVVCKNDYANIKIHLISSINMNHHNYCWVIKLGNVATCPSKLIWYIFCSLYHTLAHELIEKILKIGRKLWSYGLESSWTILATSWN